MTKTEALTEYCNAINEHTGPETKQRVRNALKGLRKFAEKGKLPVDLVVAGRKLLK